MNQIVKDRTNRTEWFMKNRFGMFIHWGLYSIPAKGEWVRSSERISNEEYQQYFDEFNPSLFDPVKWAKLAKSAGMKYAVLTAKHHDGFCLFDSKLTDYNATKTKAGRDFVKEYVEAFRAEGLKVGLYYSLIDWHHEHYPAFDDKYHPMRESEAFKGRQYDFSIYIQYMHGQIKELLSCYGKIDILWLDFSYEEMGAEKWKAKNLIEMIRSLQPDIIINNRLEANGEHSGSIKTRNPSMYSGDFASPEMIIPPHGVVDEDGYPVPWEACITMNNSWGYNAVDKLYKSPKTIILKLVECVSKNGNLLLNVGPNAKGEISSECVEILQKVGEWMQRNSESIINCGKAEFPKPEWGRYTQNGKKLYVHIFEQSIGPVNLNGMNGKLKKARLVSDGSELRLISHWVVSEYPDDAFINFCTPEYATGSLPDEINTVVELELL